ncbi:MAG: Uma2 family endonuclease [Gemmataceae bacterium]
MTIGAGFVTERDPDTVRAPDVAFITSSRKPPGRLNRYLDGSPDLCVEVMTEHDYDDEFRDRAMQYLNTGAAEVWLVRSAERTVSVQRAAGADVVFDNEMCLHGGDVLPGFSCPVADFFK